VSGAASIIPGPAGPTGPTGPKGGVTYTITSTGDGGEFVVDGLSGANPEMIAVRGEKMFFNVAGVVTQNSFALRLSQFNTSTVPGTTNNSPSTGRNGASTDTTIVYDVPINAPSQIFYVDVTDTNIAGIVTVVDKIGPTGQQGIPGPVGTPTLANYSPVLSGTGLTTTSNPAFGVFTRYGNSISFHIEIDCATITNFGTGAYQITLPVLPISVSALSFTGIIDLDGNQTDNVYQIFAQTTEGSAIAKLFTIGTGGIRTAVTGIAPVTLTTSSRLSISGSYIAQSAS
jgi:hypothetical protein